MESSAIIIPEIGGERDADAWTTITALVLDGIGSPHTRRAYSQALDEFLIWFQDKPGRVFNKAAVQRAADNDLIAPELVAGIARTKGTK